jgi:fatty-acyl-CoA synthase
MRGNNVMSGYFDDAAATSKAFAGGWFHSGVLECAVSGIPHPHWGERPMAFVTLNDGTTATPEELITFCRDRLAHYKCPDAIEFGPLPKTSTGKIQKFRLRDREWTDQDHEIGGV